MIFKRSILTLFTIVSFSCYAQNDTITIKSVDSSSTQYLTPMEYAFMFHEDTPWMLKGGLMANEGFFLGFERRIKGGFTANISLRTTGILSARLSSRYYYNMKNRNKLKSIPFNLSGNYISIGYGANNGYTDTEVIDFGVAEIEVAKRALNSSFFVQWGMQRRYMKYGFIDAAITASYNFNNKSRNELLIRSNTSVGFVFARDKSKLQRDKLCTIIKCQESNKSAIKIDLANTLDFRINKSSTILGLSPGVAYEIKLGRSAFSINNELITSLYFVNSSAKSTPEPPNFSGEARHTLETRYYFNLKNRMLKGKTGNGLSADYISVAAESIYRSHISSLSADEKYYLQLFQPLVSFGTQRFIGNHFFYDLAIGYRLDTFLFDNISEYYQSTEQIFTTSKVGFRF